MFSNVLRSSLVALAVSAATVQAAITFNNCSAEQQTVVANAASAGQSALVDGLIVIDGVQGGLSGNPSHYTELFGTTDPTKVATIQHRLQVLSFADTSTYTYTCSPTATGIAPGNTFGTFEVGPDIVSASAPTIGTVHPATHLWLSALVASVTESLPQLEDQSSVTEAETKQFLVDNGPDAAINNGPSYVFFIESITI